MSMYKFVKGSRLFMQAKRDSYDNDNIHDTFHGTNTDDRARGGYLTSSHSPSRGHRGHHREGRYRESDIFDVLGH